MVALHADADGRAARGRVVMAPRAGASSQGRTPAFSCAARTGNGGAARAPRSFYNELKAALNSLLGRIAAAHFAGSGW